MAAISRKRGRTWEHSETVLLLKKWGEDNIQERLKTCSRKKPMWEEISVLLQAAGSEDRDCEACKTRIHSLVNAYRQYKDQCSRSITFWPASRSQSPRLSSIRHHALQSSKHRRSCISLQLKTSRVVTAKKNRKLTKWKWLAPLLQRKVCKQFNPHDSH